MIQLKRKAKPMSKLKTAFVCQSCGQSYPRWSGKCPSCGEWNSLVEEVTEAEQAGKRGGAKSKVSELIAEQSLVSFASVDQSVHTTMRIATGITEFDRVLGGDVPNQGMLPGALMLIGGEPGIGKSTLLTQMVVSLIESGGVEQPLFYVCGEESPAQIALRVERVSRGGAAKTAARNSKWRGELLEFVTSTDVDVLVGLIEQRKPSVVVVDSIQTMTTADLTGVAGSVGQVREVADRLRVVAKKMHVPIFLVGHVTKEGQISGPKILEHIVDSVLELSGERTGELRLLRAVKNRFGATDEVGVFRVTSFGYDSVKNPTELFLEHAQKPVAGSATVCVMEGTRPLMLEVQALVVDSQLAMPRRVGRGIELSRIQVLSAVLQKHCHLPLATHDIFVSAAGGFSIKEPAVDLGVAVAIASSLQNVALPSGTVFIGEVGLLGEIRSVNMIERRVKEAKRLGFEHIVYRKTHATVRDVLKQFKL